jgi:uncharacterized HAD superfamily protein
MSKKERIAVDVDEVFFPFVEHFVEHSYQQYGSEKPKVYFSYEVEKVYGIPFEEAVQRVHDFIGMDHDHILPIEESIEAIEELHDRYDFTAVTARDARFQVKTKDWLHKNLREGVIEDVICIGWAIGDKPLRKVDVCRQIGAVLLIDDSLKHVSECAEEGIEGILFGDYPWNQADQLPSGVTRCKDWPAVREYLNERQR